jgi:hypothetical protein
MVDHLKNMLNTYKAMNFLVINAIPVTAANNTPISFGLMTVFPKLNHRRAVD